MKELQRAELRKFLVDENGLKMTEAATSVLISTLLSLENTDQRWSGKDLPGSPSVTDYAADVIEVLRRRYSGPGVRL